MAEWQEKYPVEYSAASDENIDSWVQKYISEISRLYLLLNRVRRNDSKAGEPDDTVPYPFPAWRRSEYQSRVALTVSHAKSEYRSSSNSYATNMVSAHSRPRTQRPVPPIAIAGKNGE